MAAVIAADRSTVYQSPRFQHDVRLRAVYKSNNSICNTYPGPLVNSIEARWYNDRSIVQNLLPLAAVATGFFGCDRDQFYCSAMPHIRAVAGVYIINAQHRRCAVSRPVFGGLASRR
jgi:hypothetical protein